MKKRKAIPHDIQLLVLHEAGYKCSNPICRHIITLDIHHLVYVSEEGSGAPDNLLPLCPNCHALHHRGEIPAASIRAWKMLLLALNEAFDRKSIDILLMLDKYRRILRMTGDGVIGLAPLVAAGLVDIRQSFTSLDGKGGTECDAGDYGPPHTHSGMKEYISPY